jgi:hypothetical protein
MVKCWGWNQFGQLGDGTNGYALYSNIPVDVCANSACTSSLSEVIGIAAGEGHTCALTNAGGVKCWGLNGTGQLGDGTATDRHTPVDVSGLDSGVSAIAGGDGHTCTLTNIGGVRCWGMNDNGQLGDGGGGVPCDNYNDICRLTPVDVCADATCSSPLSGIRAIATGNTHTCALTSGGGVKCWGSNGNGQLGNGTTTDHHTPVDVCADATCHSPLTGVIAIATGMFHACALTNTGGVKCWGRNYEGELGDGTVITQTPEGRTTPTDVCADVTCASPLSGVVAVTAGSVHTCALTSGGAVKCWGWNGDGQLGDGTTIDRHTPVDVVFPSISGRLTTIDNKPISDDVVEMIPDSGADDLRQTTSDASGFYTFTIFSSGTYTVTPLPAKSTFASDSYAYSPAWIQVKASPSAINQNFTGIPIQDSIAVRPLRQVDLPWGNQHLDSTTVPIADWGCLLTDWTMILDYFGLYNGFQPDPLTFNTWLTSHDGFATGGNLVPTAVINYAVPNGVNINSIQFISGKDNASDAYIDDSLSQGKPVILKEVITLRDGSPGTHYVLAIGKIVDGDRDTYAIVDPFFNRSSLKSYGYIYAGYYRYDLSPVSDISAVYFSAGSPVQLLVTDPLGRRTGVDPSTGQLLNEIPRASYITDTLSDLSNPSGPTHEAKMFWTQGVISGTYKMEVIGTGNGSYTLDFIGYTQSGASSRQVISGQTTIGAITTFAIPYSPSKGLGQVLGNAVYLPIIQR